MMTHLLVDCNGLCHKIYLLRSAFLVVDSTLIFFKVKLLTLKYTLNKKTVFFGESIRTQRELNILRIIIRILLLAIACKVAIALRSILKAKGFPNYKFNFLIWRFRIGKIFEEKTYISYVPKKREIISPRIELGAVSPNGTKTDG